MNPALRANGYRSAWAGDLVEPRDRARVAGWVHRRRDHGGLIFIDLRDRTGIVQIVFDPDESGPDAFAAAERLRSEHVLSVEGPVIGRGDQHVNPNIPTGGVELRVRDLDVLAAAETPPFPIDEDGEVDEVLRLRHRALDLRRDHMQRTMRLRHDVVREIREHLSAEGYMEIETPILTRSTPEGARDFLVPSRNAPGAFYALPQSPQLFKQLLMFAGFERYFQIARCFRDEDLRADRQPEFTQLDVEMSFVTEDDVIDAMERTMAKVFTLAGLDVPAPPYRRMPYAEALARYGSDRPDTRFGLEIVDLGEELRGSDFKVFEGVLGGGGVVRALNLGAAGLSRSELDGLNEVVQRHGGKAVAWAVVESDAPTPTWRSPIAKFLGEERIAAATAKLGGASGDILLFVADQERIAAPAIGGLRLELGRRLGLIPDGHHDLLWIVDFPMFEFDPGEDRWNALHHPFTAPLGDLADPGTLTSRAYDLVLDGTEIGGGSIRIHDPAVQERVLEILGMDAEEAAARFGFLLEALRHGAPPHGGIAFGIDRIVAICCGRESIRDVIAFPKTASGADPLTGAPAEVDDRQLRELALRRA